MRLAGIISKLRWRSARISNINSVDERRVIGEVTEPYHRADQAQPLAAKTEVVQT